MRRIQTQTDIDKKKRKNQILVGGVMIALLLFSIVGYSFSSGDNNEDESKMNEAGVDFFRQNGFWVAEIDGTVFRFQNLPSEVNDVNVNISANLAQYSGQPLYFVNPNEGTSEVLTNLGNYILRYQESCLRQDSGIGDLGLGIGDDDLSNLSVDDGNDFVCEGDLPVKNCDSNLIIFVNGNESEVYQNGNCVFIVGETLRATDAFLYKVLQII